LLSLRATICAEIDSGVTNDDHAEFSRNVCTT
jgi:hypothetical protein